MGNSLESYRASIGLFHTSRLVHVVCFSFSQWLANIVLCELLPIFIIVIMLLLSGDIEINPGPDANIKNNIAICQLNIHSLKERFSVLKSTLGLDHDIIAVTETLLRPYHNFNFDIDGFYPIFRLDRTDRGGGGCAVFFRNNLCVTRLSHLEVPDIEAMWFKVRSNNNVFILCVCYRPPDSPTSFWDTFQTQLDLAKQESVNNILITGDLNSDPHSNSGTYLFSFANQNHLTVHVDEPTRITEHTATILDQILSNMPYFVEDVTVLPPLTDNDHCTVSCKVLFKSVKKSSYNRRVWLYNRADFEGFRETLSNFDWNQCFLSESIHEICDNWTSTFLNIAMQFIPNKLVTIRPNDNPWYSSELRCMKRKVDRLHSKAKKSSNNPEVWTRFRQLRNEYCRCLKQAEHDYENKLSETLKDSTNLNPKMWWKVAKSFLGYNNDSSYPPIKTGDSVLFDDFSKAEAFNSFFLGHSNIDTSNATLPDPVRNHEQEISNFDITAQDVIDQLKCIDTSKSTGPDNISPRMLKEAGESISYPLSRLFQLSLNTCTVPQSWKQANVLPLHKKNEKDIMNNYRPISLLSCVGKIFERLVFKQVFNFFRENNLITSFQSGFMPGDSTVNQLVQLYHIFCEALDMKKDVRIVFCDISKAFDRVWHEGLIYKLEAMGITGNLLSWFKNYLKDRQQRVIIQGKTSSWGDIKAGVPQGSILGPLLFLVYINDITNNISSNIRLFADDTTIFVTVDDATEAAEVLNSDLRCISNWATRWLVTFSPPKTECMLVSLRKNSLNHPALLFNNNELTNVKTHKHLGLVLSDDLKWDNHIDNIVKTAGKRVDVLSRLMFKLDRHTLEILYTAFIRPTLEYGDVLLSNITDMQCEKLELVQKRVGKIVSGAIRGVSRDVIYHELGWETLEERRKKHMLLLFHKIVHGKSPAYLSALLPYRVQQQSTYELRNSDDFIQYNTRTTLFKNSFYPSTVREWNLLSPELKNITEIDAFKLELCRNAPKPNCLFYLGRRKAGITHARIRMKCSSLRAHLFALHVIDNTKCECGHDYEDELHYFFTCQLYHRERAILHEIIIQHAPFNLHTVLYGIQNGTEEINEIVFNAVHNYLDSTLRFS